MIGGASLLLYAEGPTLQDISIKLTSLLGGGVHAHYLLGFTTRVGDARAVWAGVACTLTFTLWTMGVFPEAWSVPFDTYYTAAIGNFVMFGVGFGVAALLPARPRDLDGLPGGLVPDEMELAVFADYVHDCGGLLFHRADGKWCYATLCPTVQGLRGPADSDEEVEDVVHALLAQIPASHLALLSRSTQRWFEAELLGLRIGLYVARSLLGRDGRRVGSGECCGDLGLRIGAGCE